VYNLDLYSLKGRDNMSESSSGANDCVNKKIDKRMNGIINSEGKIIFLTERGKSLDELLNHPYIKALIQKVGALHNDLSCIDKLVNILGYAIYNYSDKLQIIFPKNKIYGPGFTSAQITTIFELAGEYHENADTLCEALEKNDNDLVENGSRVYKSSHVKVQSA
jgi:hypothetical protein